MLSPNGASYLLSYYQWTVGIFKKADPKLWVVLSDGFMQPQFWNDKFGAQERIVFDAHHYTMYTPLSPDVVGALDICPTAQVRSLAVPTTPASLSISPRPASLSTSYASRHR